MSAISSRPPGRGRPEAAAVSVPRAEDPRVARSRAAVLEAARSLFLANGYAGTTVEDIAARAGITKRTVYNNYRDKEALFREIVGEVIAYAEDFARSLPGELAHDVEAAALPAALHDFGRRLALAILRPEIVALRRMIIGEARIFPELAREYFERAPGRVLAALATRFRELDRAGLLTAPDPHRAAEHFAYLVVAASLDRAIVVGDTPSEEHLRACARDGVETFLARYVPGTTASDP